MSTDSILDIDKTVFPWPCASGFSSEMLRALQDTDEDGLLPSSTLSPLSVFATTLEQFLHHWDVVEVILSLFYLPVSLSTFNRSNNLCYVSCSAVNRWHMFLILLSSALSPVSISVLSHLLCQLVWLVNHLVALVSVCSSVCCWLDSFALHCIFTCHKTIFLASNNQIIFLSQLITYMKVFWEKTPNTEENEEIEFKDITLL